MEYSFRTKLPLMHYACAHDDFRRSLNYVLITKENIVASDANILVIHKTKQLFGDEFVDSIPKRFLIHWKIWKEMCTPKIISINFDKDKKMIEVVHLEENEIYSIFLPIEMETKTFKYPYWHKVIPTKKYKSNITRISFNPNILENFRKAFFQSLEIGNMRFEFYGEDRAIRIFKNNDYSESHGLIMPIQTQILN